MHRVVVHLPPGHPEHGGGVEAESVHAFRLGGIEEGVHNAPPGHQPVPFDEFVASVVEQARAEYPQEGVRVEVEVLVDNGDGTAHWLPEAEFDPEQHTMQGGGVVRERVVSVTTEQHSGRDD